MKRISSILLLLVLVCCLCSCGRNSVSEAVKILGGDAVANATKDTIDFVTAYAVSESDIEGTLEWCKKHGYKDITMEIHGKNGVGFCHITNDIEEYRIEYEGKLYDSYKEDFYRISECQHPYLISQEAADFLYFDYKLMTGPDFYENVSFSPEGSFIYYFDDESEFLRFENKFYEIAEGLFEKDEFIKDVDFQVRDSYYSNHYFRDNEEAVYASEDIGDYVFGADPSDIHTYVDCGEIVQHSPLTGDGDFGDVDIEIIVDDRYVTIYSDGTYYYMFDYMNDMLTIAYIK